jgi:hypothetical protein
MGGMALKGVTPFRRIQLQNLSENEDERKAEHKIKLKDIFFLINLKKVIILIIIVGIILRACVFFNSYAGYDASYYITLGKGYAERGNPYLPFGDIETDSLNPTVCTSPRQIFPIYLSLFYLVLGYSFMISKIAVTFLSIITLIVIYLTTRNLYSRNCALIVTCIMSVMSILIFTTGTIYTENMTFLLFAIGLWGLVKGDKFLPIGIVFMSFFYISRCYSFMFYILLVLLFYLWLLYAKRKRDLNMYHFISLLCAIPFAFLLYYSKTNCSFPMYRISFFEVMSSAPLYIGARYLQVLFFVLVYTFGFTIYFIKPLRRTFSIRNVLWMVVITFLLGFPLIMAYQDYIYALYNPSPREQLRIFFYITLPLLWLSIPNIKYDMNEKLRLSEISRNLKSQRGLRKNKRLFYVMITTIVFTTVLIPQVWLLFILAGGLLSLFFVEMRWKIVILCLILMVSSLNDNTGVSYEYNRRLGEDMNRYIEDGDVIMLDGISFVKPHNQSKFDRYILAPYVTKTYRIINFDSNETPDYIITQNIDINFHNYSVLKRYYNNDKNGIFTQIYNLLHLTFTDYHEGERTPIYILWERERNLS